MLKKVNTGVQIEQFIRSQEEWGAAEPPPQAAETPGSAEGRGGEGLRHPPGTLPAATLPVFT